MNKIAMDIVGPLKRTARGNAYILTIYDTFSHKRIPHHFHTVEGGNQLY